MVEEGFWCLIDICVLNSWVIYRSNFPNSTINTHKLFCLKLIEELVQPLLTLRASPACPRYLYTKGREPVAADSHLLWKHFSYKHSKRHRGVQFVVRKSQLLVKEWIRKLKTIALSAMFFCALENVLKHTIYRQVISKTMFNTLYVQTEFLCCHLYSVCECT